MTKKKTTKKKTVKKKGFSFSDAWDKVKETSKKTVDQISLASKKLSETQKKMSEANKIRRETQIQKQMANLDAAEKQMALKEDYHQRVAELRKRQFELEKRRRESSGGGWF